MFVWKDRCFTSPAMQNPHHYVRIQNPRDCLFRFTLREMEELPISPSGVCIQQDFITPDHERELIRIFSEDLEWPDRRGRLSLHYGYEFSYKTFGLEEDGYIAFPDWLVPLLPTTEDRPPDSICLQQYAPGTGIPPHCDTHGPFDQLYALSLGSPVFMQFAEGGTTGRKVDVDLPARSMMQMRGDARLHWTHGIRARKTDTLADGTVRPRGYRWSITYRWRREGGECECGDEGLCDTAMRRKGEEKPKRWQLNEAKGEEGAAG
jgi:hypothetical protein